MLNPGVFHALFLTLAGMVTGGLALYAWRHRDKSGARALSAAMVGVTWWTCTEILALSQTGASHVVWERVQWTAIAVVPIFFFFFIVEFTGYGWLLSRRSVPLFLLVPAVTIVIAWTNPFHHLLFVDPVTIQTGGIVTLDQQFGPWFWVYFLYAYSLMFIGFLLLLRLVTVSDYLYFDQTVLIVVGVFAPLAGNAITVFGVAPLEGLDLTPYGFTITAIAFGNALFRYRLFDLLPATRKLGQQAALVDLDDGIVIVDSERRVLYLNPAAGSVFECDPSDAFGDHVNTLVDTRKLDFAATDRLAELTLNDRTYEVETAPISDSRDERVGHTILLYDVTERTRREAELRAQRDQFQRLERINTVIRDVNQALIGVTTAAELQRAVVETLSTPGLYDEVWLTTIVTSGAPVRMAAGDDGPRTGAVETLPPGLETQPEPTAVGRETTVESENTDGSWATVALVYGRTVFGALALRTNRETGFDGRETDVLDELGETIGHALSAIERTHLLVADTRVEVDIESKDCGALLVALTDATDDEWTLDGLVPATEGDLVAYLSTDADSTDVDSVASHGGVSDVRPVATDGGTTLEVRASGGMLAHPFVETGANVRNAVASDGCCRLTVELSPDANVRAVVERVGEEFPGTELVAKREIEPTEQTALPDDADMTDRQQEALEAAFRAGYYDWPRESTAEEVADSLDIASPTLHGHLRKAENQMLRSFFEE